MRMLLEKFHDQIDTLKNLHGKQIIGMIGLQLEDFKNEVMPSPLKLLSMVEKAIPL